MEIFEKMKLADGIIFGSPVYTANVSANIQAFLERASVVTDMNQAKTCFSIKWERRLQRQGAVVH